MVLSGLCPRCILVFERSLTLRRPVKLPHSFLYFICQFGNNEEIWRRCIACHMKKRKERTWVGGHALGKLAWCVIHRAHVRECTGDSEEAKEPVVGFRHSPYVTYKGEEYTKTVGGIKILCLCQWIRAKT